MNEKLNGRGKVREMNELNYASLEASKRLVDAGIVLETETSFYNSLHSKDWKLYRTEDISGINNDPLYKVHAPSMAEVWRELPSYIGDDFYLDISKDDTQTVCGYSKIDVFDRYVSKGNQRNDNPTDALIDLLIWVRKEEIKR